MDKYKYIAMALLAGHISIANAMSSVTFIDYNDFLPVNKVVRTYTVTNFNVANPCYSCLSKVVDEQVTSTNESIINRKRIYITGVTTSVLIKYQKKDKSLNGNTETYKDGGGTLLNINNYSNDFYILKSIALSDNIDSNYYLSSPLAKWNIEYTNTIANSSGVVSKYLSIVSSTVEKVSSVSLPAGNYSNCLKLTRSLSSENKIIDWYCPSVGMVKRLTTSTSGQNVLWEMSSIQ